MGVHHVFPNARTLPAIFFFAKSDALKLHPFLMAHNFKNKRRTLEIFVHVPPLVDKLAHAATTKTLSYLEVC